MEQFIGQILLVPFNFAPRGWALCNGQLLSVLQNQSLFSLLGTTYGGDGKTTFAVPDLRGRCVVGMGQAPGMHFYALGEQGGKEQVTLNTMELPAHSHVVMASTSNGATSSPTEALLANAQVTIERGTTVGGNSYIKANPDTTLHPHTIQPSGGNLPHENRQPYITMNYIISLEGEWPSRT